jgi:integrase
LLKQVSPKIGKTAIDKVERRRLIDLLNDLEESNGPSAARHAFSMIRQLFNWCIQQGYIEHSPCAGMKAPGKVKQRERVLSRAELARIWRAADEMSYPMAQFVKLLALTGQRRSEVAKMRWTDIDFEQKQWIQPSSANKSARPHVVPLADGVIDILMTLPRFEGEYVFPAKGRSNRAISGFSKWKKELDRRSGVNDWVLHDFRRTVATELAKAGHAIHVVELVLNHSSQKLGGVAGIYNRYQYETEKARALQDWASRVDKLVLNAR